MTRKMTSGARFRRDVSQTLDLERGDPVWLALLDQVCETIDLIEEMADEVDGNLTVAGSKGQQVPNGLLGELRQQRLALARMLTGLGLNDQPESEAQRTARGAARARWHGRRLA